MNTQKILNDSEVESMHEATLPILAEVDIILTQHILCEHQIEPLSESKSKKLDVIMASAEKELIIS